MLSSQQPPVYPPWADAPIGLTCTLDGEVPAVVWVTLSGELDIATVPELEQALSEAASGSAAVVLDLSQLTFMDSSGLHTILTARDRLAQAGCRLVLIPGGRHIQRIFELTGIGRMLEFVSASAAPGRATS